jgi:ATP-dependent DNA helicase RecQ
VGGEFDKRQWQAVFRQMMGHDLVRPNSERHGALTMTERARPVLRDEERVELRRDTIRVTSRRPAAKTLVSEENTPLMSALKAKRRALAEAAKVPAYVIFPDRTLAEMAETRPADLDEMARVRGVGAKKLANYGDAFLEVINGEAEQMHPSRRKIAGRQDADLYDQLLEAQSQLMRGPAGIDKPMSCSASLLAKIASQKPRTSQDMERLLGDRRADRFGAAFLDVLNRTD